jgi:hypothetical protein
MAKYSLVSSLQRLWISRAIISQAQYQSKYVLLHARCTVLIIMTVSVAIAATARVEEFIESKRLYLITV